MNAFLHSGILAFLVSFYYLVRSRWEMEQGSYGQKTLEQMIYSVVVSAAWIIYGMQAGVDDRILAIEGFTVCIVLVSVVLKLNTENNASFIGKVIPGHGAPEARWMVVLKWILLAPFALIAVAGVLILLVMAIGNLFS